MEGCVIRGDEAGGFIVAVGFLVEQEVNVVMS